MPADSVNPWLVLIHQLPPRPPYLRVKVWRRLQALGSVPIKNSVYVLPNTDDAREDFEWMLQEITRAGGEASLCEARLVDGLTDTEVQGSFQTAREQDYRELATSIRTLGRETLPRRGRAPSDEARAKVAVGLARFRKRLEAIAKVDFFNAPGRETAEGLLRDLEGKLAPSEEDDRARLRQKHRMQDVQGRVWVTRAGVHIDRMASAWLIRRFIDQRSKFKFVPSKGYCPEADELRFDMFDAEFTHQGDLCTFEVLLREFGLAEPGLAAIGEVVHDIDMKEAKFDRSETAGVDHLIAGIAWSHGDDDGRLAQATALFDALYAYFKRRKE
jgi:hypothetical protein